MSTPEYTVEDQLVTDLVTYFIAHPPASLSVVHFRGTAERPLPALIIGHEGCEREKAMGMTGTGRVNLRLVVESDMDVTAPTGAIGVRQMINRLISCNSGCTSNGTITVTVSGILVPGGISVDVPLTTTAHPTRYLVVDAIVSALNSSLLSQFYTFSRNSTILHTTCNLPAADDATLACRITTGYGITSVTDIGFGDAGHAASHRELVAAVDAAFTALTPTALALSYVHAILRESPADTIQDRRTFSVLAYTVVSTRCTEV